MTNEAIRDDLLTFLMAGHERRRSGWHSRSTVSAQLPTHSKWRRDRTVMVSTLYEVDTIDERCFELFET